MDEEILAQYKKLAEHAYSAHLTAYAEQSKWILASLLAVNGGALIGLGQSSSISLGIADPWAAFILVIGAVMAIVSGGAARRQSLAVTETFMQFLTAATNEERHAALTSAVGREKLLSRLSDGAAFLSGLCFVVGVVFAGSHLHGPGLAMRAIH